MHASINTARQSSAKAVAAALVMLLAGCQSVPPPATPSEPAAVSPPPVREPFRNIYTQDKDSAPAAAHDMDYHAIPEPVPQREPLSRYGNKSPYVVNGRSYTVLAQAEGYRAEGIASWYGKKFHGFMTSSMEPYDMHALTAAHTSLPIPSYVRVTHLGNGKSVVVRVNDRGPFHPERIIDLSWAAANRLGYADSGTARVRVEALALPAAAPVAATTAGESFFVQLGAFAFVDAANRLAEQVRGTLGENPQVNAGDDRLHRVRLGPYASRSDAERMRDRLRDAGLGNPSLVTAP
ncbi:MAG: septal ring lytic transglycosylase RlpA family protein [Gammaproteobacteria bacterium]